MRVLVQRVSRARVTVRDEGSPDRVVGEIGPGLCALVGVTHTDDESTVGRMAEKLWRLRVFDDADGVMNLALADTGGSVLVVSQFTLYGDTRKGRRPSYVGAARPEHAEPLVERFVAELAALGAAVVTGRFRADMAVELVNDGPVTLLVET